MNKKELIKRLNKESEEGTVENLDVIVVEELGKKRGYDFEHEITDVAYNEQDDIIIISVRRVGQFWM